MARAKKTVSLVEGSTNNNVENVFNPFVQVLVTKGVTVITDTNALETEGVNLSQSIRSQDERIASYLWSEVLHIEQHRNPTRLNKFFTSVEKRGARADAMMQFVLMAGNVRLSTPKELAEKVSKDKGAPYVLARILSEDGKTVIMMQHLQMLKTRTPEVAQAAFEKALEKGEWWNHKQAPGYQEFDLRAKVAALIATATKHVKEPKEGDKIDPVVLSGLKILAETTGIEFKDATKTVEAPSITPDEVPAQPSAVTPA